MGVYHTVFSTFEYIWKFPLNKQNRSPRLVSSWLSDSRRKEGWTWLARLHHTFNCVIKLQVIFFFGENSMYYKGKCCHDQHYHLFGCGFSGFWEKWLKWSTEIRTWQGWMNPTTSTSWPYRLLKHFPALLTLYHLKKGRDILAAFSLNTFIFNSLRREQIREKSMRTTKITDLFSSDGDKKLRIVTCILGYLIRISST